MNDQQYFLQILFVILLNEYLELQMELHYGNIDIKNLDIHHYYIGIQEDYLFLHYQVI
jgi:hypothetical protein